MVRAASKEDVDLYALAQAAGKEGGAEAGAQEGVPVRRNVQGSGPRGINQNGDDPGFETRVKAPTAPKPTQSPRDTKGPDTDKKAPRGRATAQERSLQDVADSLEEKFAVIFALVANPLPVTGTYGVENSGKAVAALLNIAKRRPIVMKALMTVADGADGLQIGMFAAGLATAIQVDLGRIPADAMPARVTGVTDIVEKYFGEEIPEENPAMTVQVTNAPRFQPVS